MCSSVECQTRWYMSPSLKSTFIALIPKKSNPDVVSVFHPIIFCHVLYKLVSNVITNGLKLIMHYIISINQSTFIMDRLITNNITVAHELLHTMKYNTRGKSGKITVKLNYIEATMKALRFVEK